MPTKLALAALLILSLPVAAEARSVTLTTGKGGSFVRSGTCAQSTGQLTCQGHATATGAQGRTATRDRSTRATTGQITSTLSGTRGNGQGFSRSAEVKH
jgi:hypothetical protein